MFNDPMSWVFGLHVVSTFGMLGLIWLVLLVHYPLLAHIGEDNFLIYHSAHVKRISLVVIPFMSVELVTGILLFYDPLLPLIELGFSLALLAIIWLSTFLLQVPQHSALSKAPNPTNISALVQSNWVRTIGWSARGVLVLIWITHHV